MAYNNYGRKPKRKPIYDETTGVPPTDDQIAAMTKQAYNVSYYWLERQDQPRANLYKKIKNKGITDEVAEKVLNDLEERGLIDDRRFAENFIYSKTKYEKLTGFPLRQKLQQKGISREIIDELMMNVDEEETEENAYELARKKLKTTKKYEPQKRIQNIAASLIRKGYAPGLAFRVTKEVLQEELDTQEAEESFNEDGYYDEYPQN